MKSWGQYGEDRLLGLFFKGQDQGFVVELGAADGQTNSNSRCLLQRPGWKGLLIEPEPVQFHSLYSLYKDCPGVCCINGAVGRPRKQAAIYCGGQVSTLLPEFKSRCEKAHGIQYQESLVNVTTLTELMSQAKAPANFDFLSIDCEGMEWEVWNTLDRSKYSPRLVCMEGAGYSMDGYFELCRVGGNTFYVRLDEPCAL